VATRVLIIEDEPIIAMDIEAIVTDLGHEVLGIARTLGEAMAIVATCTLLLRLLDAAIETGRWCAERPSPPGSHRGRAVTGPSLSLRIRVS
jgi:AmiR/NasT family two-component response regulator